MNKSVIYVAYYNSSENRLDEIPAEISGIQDLFLPFRKTLYCHVEPANIKPADIFNRLTDFGQDLAIFHYSGHAAGQHLQLKEEYQREQLVNILTGKFPNLVFLNGCMTAGFIDDLLEIGVGAVIATSTTIGDSEAREFSLNFYKAFLKPNTSLNDAFKSAISTLQLSAKVNIQPNRSLDTGEDELPTKILLSARNSASLRVTITTLSPLQAGIVDEEIRGITETIEELRQQKQIKEKTLGALNKDAEEIINTIKGEIDDLVSKINKETKKQAELIDQRNRLAFEQSLPDKLSELDYREQRRQVTRWFRGTVSQPSHGAFLLQGTSYCGVEILQSIIRKILGATHLIYDPIPIYCRASSSEPLTAELIWTIIGEKIGWKPSADPAKKQEEIMELVCTNYLVNGHLVITLLDAQHYTDSLNIELILKFWGTVNSFLTQKSPSHKLLFFILEKVAININDTSTYTGPFNLLDQRRTAYQTEFAKTPTVLTLPRIQPISVDQISEWADERDLITLPLAEFQPQNFMLQAIEKICEGIKCPSVFIRHFQSFVPKKADFRQSNPFTP